MKERKRDSKEETLLQRLTGALSELTQYLLMKEISRIKDRLESPRSEDSRYIFSEEEARELISNLSRKYDQEDRY